MIVGENVAKVSDSPEGCTFQSDRYEASIGNDDYYIYDTVGLNEGDQGRVPHWKAIQRLYTLIRELDSVSLLLYCIRGRIKENARANWTLFRDIICGGEVPVVIVETGLEQNLEGEGRRPVLETALRKYGISPEDVICVVSILGKNEEYREVYESSQQQLRELVERSRRTEPWSTEKDFWLASIYQEVITRKFCFPGSRLEFVEVVEAAINKFVQAGDMGGEYSKKLKASLLDGEKKFRKNPTFKDRIQKVFNV